jgi:hypothetical protein
MGRSSEYHEEFSIAHFIMQFLLICMVIYLWSAPVMLPVKLLVVLFHEMSHGFMALATGGQVIEIIVTLDEGGSCETEGGSALFIISAGYLGSMFAGGLLLYLSRFRSCVPGVYIVLTVTLTAAIFTVLHDPNSRTLATSLAGAFIFLGLVAPAVVAVIVLRIVGTVGCLYSIFDIYWDVLATHGAEYAAENDAVAFSRLTDVSPESVGMAWLAVSVVYFLVILKSMVTSLPDSVPTHKTASAAA